MSAAPITDTGIRGFLKWFKREQPAIYARVAPIIAKKVPAAFSDYNQGGWKTAGLSQDDARKKLAKLSQIYSGNFPRRATMMDGLSDYASYAATMPRYATYTSSAPITTSYTASPLTAEITPSYTPVDTSVAANTGPAGTITTSQIGNVINAASQAALAVNSAQLQNSIVQMQLQRAASGLAPLNTSLSASGIPIAGSSNTTGLLLIGALVVGGALLAAR